MASSSMTCKVCNNSKDNNPFEVREMMFGYRDVFSYFQCSQCGCLQISAIPSNLTKYYPPSYYSYNDLPAKGFKNPIMRIIRSRRDRYSIFGRGWAGKLLYKKFPDEPLRSLSGITELREDARILDVGCGAGALLCTLKENGFRNLLGVDPYITHNIEYGDGLRILKEDLQDIEGAWDVIMFHHSFEHMPDQVDAILAVARLLAPNGVCLIRTPTVSSYAWEHYGVNWVQLDAPRHFFIHSLMSIKILAANANLNLEKAVYDSTAFQFWGSEQYVKNIPLISERSYAVNRANSIFSKIEMAKFKQQANRLNSEGGGDSAVFYLRRRNNLS